MSGEHMTRQEWTRTLLGIGLVVAVAVLIDAQPGKNHSFLLMVLAASFLVTFGIGLLFRIFSKNTSPESVRLNQEVHP